jgi:hypothetical protein
MSQWQNIWMPETPFNNLIYQIAIYARFINDYFDHIKRQVLVNRAAFHAQYRDFTHYLKRNYPNSPPYIRAYEQFLRIFDNMNPEIINKMYLNFRVTPDADLHAQNSTTASFNDWIRTNDPTSPVITGDRPPIRLNNNLKKKLLAYILTNDVIYIGNYYDRIKRLFKIPDIVREINNGIEQDTPHHP